LSAGTEDGAGAAETGFAAGDVTGAEEETESALGAGMSTIVTEEPPV